jgi:hypothetical protein
MPKNYDYNEQFKDRLKALPFWAGLFAIVFLINKGIWALDKVIVMYLFIAFVLIKFFAIIFRGWQLWVRESKKIGFLLLLLLILFGAFILDFEVVPKLLAYGSGSETQGHVTDFIVTTKSHFVVYEFAVKDLVFKKQQIVSISYFKTLSIGEAVKINYLKDNPQISFLADFDHLKFETTGTLFLGFGLFASLYATEIKDKITSVIKSGLHFRKPA